MRDCFLFRHVHSLKLHIAGIIKNSFPSTFHIRHRQESRRVPVPGCQMAGAFVIQQPKWSCPEDVPGIDLEEKLSVAALHDKVTKLLSGHPALLERSFQQVSQDGPSGGSALRIMQWNILADALSMGEDNFVRCPIEALKWPIRRMRILQEILRVNPDVLTLQEVDHFGFFKHVLATCGYRGIFFPKPHSPTLYVDGNSGPDGCAIFYRAERLRLLKEDSIVLRTLPGKVCTNQVAIIADFTVRNAGRAITVVTTHLKAKSGWEQLRFEQGSYLVQYLEERYASKALVVCGDFNSDCDEPVYSVFRKSVLRVDSAYRVAGGVDEEPAYTTWKIRGCPDGQSEESKRSLDYVWYARDKLVLRAVLGLPSPEMIGEDRLPSHSYPSDHLALATDFDLK